MGSKKRSAPIEESLKQVPFRGKPIGPLCGTFPLNGTIDKVNTIVNTFRIHFVKSA